MKERFGAQDPKSMMLRFHTQTGGVTLTAQQPQNNIVRVALQAFAAVCGGTQSLHTNGYDEALALPSERAAKIALRTQQIVAHESGATDTVDPFAGSYYVESLTAEIERRAWKLIESVDELGGSVDAIAFIKNEIEESAFGYHERYRTEQDVVVGVNRYVEDDAEVEEILSRRPGHRARADRAPEGVQGRPRPGARRPPARGAARGGARDRQPARRRSARRWRTAARSARCAARCATSSASTSRNLMQAVVSTPGGERRAELRDVPVPEAEPGEVLVRVHAAGINRGELTLVEIREDFRPGQEVAGVVAAGPREGERVVGLADWHGWAEYATVPEHRLVTLPDAIGFATAAALPMAGTTALNLIRLGGDLLGRDVTVTGASGGVGVIAVQLARLAGAERDRRVGGDRGLARRPGPDPRVRRRRVARPGDRQGRGAAGSSSCSATPRRSAPPSTSATSPAATPLASRRFYSAAHEHKAADNLRTLLGLVADGALQVQVGLETPLAEVNDALDALAARQSPARPSCCRDEATLLALALLLAAPASAQAAFGVSSFTVTPSTLQAGSHPDVTVAIGFSGAAARCATSRSASRPAWSATRTRRRAARRPSSRPTSAPRTRASAPRRCVSDPVLGLPLTADGDVYNLAPGRGAGAARRGRPPAGRRQGVPDHARRAAPGRRRPRLDHQRHPVARSPCSASRRR